MILNTRQNQVWLPFANLTETVLIGASLKGGNPSNADLSGVFLPGTDLTRADLKDANLVYAKLSGAYYDLSTKWPDGFDLRSAGVKLSVPKEAVVKLNVQKHLVEPWREYSYRSEQDKAEKNG